MKKIVLLYCPGCGETETLEVHKDEDAYGKLFPWFVFCPRCRWSGPNCFSEGQARKMWNKRYLLGNWST